MKNKVLTIFYDTLKTVSKDNIARYMKNHYPIEYKYIIDSTRSLDKFDSVDKNKKISIFERIYCIEHDLLDRPKCKNCKTNYVCGFNKQKNEYRKWCSAKCQASDEECILESKSTRLKKYGCETFHNVEKAKQTRLRKNGGKWHSDNFGDQVKLGKLKNGHSENWVNPDLAKKTKLKKWGSSNFNNKEKNKITRKTNFYDTLMQDKHVIPMFSLEEYINGDKNTVFKWKCRDCGTEFTSKFNYNFKCLCNTEYHVRCTRCFPYEMTKKSDSELELLEFVKSIEPNSIGSDRTIIDPYELDIYCPTKKMAFEFDGLYWHSDEYKDRTYHVFKSEECEKNGITLIHVFENEWNNKKDIVKSRIKNMFGIYDNVVFARKCDIKLVDKKTSRCFQQHNHIQDAVNASVSIGLYAGGDLISLMTFGKCRYDRKYEWEMLRFCCKLGYHVPGAAGRLLKYFERNYKPASLITYADRRWSAGRLYRSLGFDFTHNSPPNYWYFKDGSDILFSRVAFQKHKLASKLAVFDKTKSEYENMLANGWHRIFDCGNMVFAKVYA